jgi:DNA-binding PadR family transcriptional regulator
MKAKNLTKKILKRIGKSITDEILYTINSHESYRDYSRRLWGIVPRQKQFSNQVYKTLYRMGKQGWVEKKKIHDQIYFRLTREGRIRQRLLKFKISMKKKANYSTVVIFDIPEAKSSFRQFVRRFLLQNGFIALQKSAFVTGNVLTEEFYDLLREMKVLEHMTFIRGKIIHKI